MKTIICDIDGTLVTYKKDTLGIVKTPHDVLPGVIKHMNRWENEGCKIILMTGRRENLRKITEEELTKLGIPFDQLIMGCADSGRVLINDEGSKVKAHAVSLPRDKGFNDYDWREVGLTKLKLRKNN
jgi:hydroxymethylpyrimidine pyrophosphatase-like HAD family hydrolase|tara:strand:+ start:2975 stop:3355 length:381 start_codon:yes stop_codon:yes gene_type:complete